MKIRMPFSFLNTSNEWHSFVMGFFEAFCLFVPAAIRGQLPSSSRTDSEYWYYGLGRGLGLPAAILFAIGIAKLIAVVF